MGECKRTSDNNLLYLCYDSLFFSALHFRPPNKNAQDFPPGCSGPAPSYNCRSAPCSAATCVAACPTPALCKQSVCPGRRGASTSARLMSATIRGTQQKPTLRTTSGSPTIRPACVDALSDLTRSPRSRSRGKPVHSRLILALLGSCLCHSITHTTAENWHGRHHGLRPEGSGRCCIRRASEPRQRGQEAGYVSQMRSKPHQPILTFFFRSQTRLAPLRA